MARPNPAARAGVIAAAQHLMTSRGYAATTVDQICEAAGVTKGTFFHYFSSKEALAAVALEEACRAQLARYADAPFTRERDALKRLDGFIAFTIDSADPTRHACLAGVFAQEVSDTHPELRAICADALGKMRDTVKPLLDDVKRAYGPRARVDTAALAQHYVTIFEGSFIIAKANADARSFADSLRHFAAYVRALFVPAATSRRPAPRKAVTRKSA
jgi:TetR/AcrR family transcriptional repressor of nem operon